MKLAKSRLKQIIKEELNNVLAEAGYGPGSQDYYNYHSLDKPRNEYDPRQRPFRYKNLICAFQRNYKDSLTPEKARHKLELLFKHQEQHTAIEILNALGINIQEYDPETDGEPLSYVESKVDINKVWELLNKEYGHIFGNDFEKYLTNATYRISANDVLKLLNDPNSEVNQPIEGCL